MSVIPTGYGQINIVYGGSALPTKAENVLGFRNVAGDSASTIAAAVKAMVISRIVPRLITDHTFETLRVKLGPNETGPFAEVSAGNAGALSTGSASPAVAILMRKVTALGGRKNSGRLFFPSIGESALGADGVIESATLTATTAAWTNLLTDMAAADYPCYLLHNDETSPTLVTSISAQSVAATQRRRQRR